MGRGADFAGWAVGELLEVAEGGVVWGEGARVCLCRMEVGALRSFEG